MEVGREECQYKSRYTQWELFFLHGSKNLPKEKTCLVILMEKNKSKGISRHLTKGKPNQK